MKYLYLLLLCPLFAFAQLENADELFKTYDRYKETSLNKRRIKHRDIQPLLNRLQKNQLFTITKLGHSVEGRSISMISYGKGKTNVLLWSQMHGDEPTATMAIFDILNYIEKHPSVLAGLKIHFIPMLNPDGAESFRRRNALDIDINRDALRLQSPESKILKQVRDSLQAQFGFNLHDQSKYYNAERTGKPATISFLAPAYNYQKDINKVRSNAMKIIVLMNQTIQKYAPNQVGRYNDDFEPRAFGDNIQKWGTSTILIESGGYSEDPEKQFIRQLNYVSILSALNAIEQKSYLETNTDLYFKIPRNDRKLFDLKITKVNFNYLGQPYQIDIGINRYEKDNNNHTSFYQIGRIQEVGDLSTYYGYQDIDASNLHFKVGQTYPKILQNLSDVDRLDFKDLLKNGYTSVAVSNLDSDIKFTNYPINIISAQKMTIALQTQPKSPVKIGHDATFLLEKNGQVEYAIINGFVYNLKNDHNNIINSIVK